MDCPRCGSDYIAKNGERFFSSKETFAPYRFSCSFYSTL